MNIVNSQNQNALLHHIYQHRRGFFPHDDDSCATCLLLFTAGESTDGLDSIPHCLLFEDLKLNLKHICREAIRKHLLDVDPHTHLFIRVPQLQLPSSLTEYLLYNLSLNGNN